MGWHCVFIDKTRIAKAVNVTFRNMLLARTKIKVSRPTAMSTTGKVAAAITTTFPRLRSTS